MNNPELIDLIANSSRPVAIYCSTVRVKLECRCMVAVCTTFGNIATELAVFRG